MFQPTKADGTVVGPARLSIKLDLEPPNGAQNPEEKRSQYYSLGTSAHLSFSPDPETGKRLVLVPNGPSPEYRESTNAHMLIKSLWDTGMPQDFLVDSDLTALEGIITHMRGMPEPEERKAFASSTSEVQMGQPDRKIPVVMEVKVAPWLQLRAIIPANAAISRLVPAATPAKKVNGPATPNTAPALTVADMDLESLASETIAHVIEDAGGQGMKKMTLRTGCFKALGDHPQKRQILDTYLDNEENLAALLNTMGFAVNGRDIVMA
jgi:hypothetical protein